MSVKAELILTRDEWYAEVVRISRDRDYGEWFYADREAWLELSAEMTPREAVDYNVGECAL